MEIRKVDEKIVKNFAKKEWLKFDIDIYGKRRGKKFAEEFYHRNYTVAAFDDKKRVLGYAKFKIDGGVGNLDELLVRKGMRGRGVGDALIKIFEKECKKKGCHKLALKSRMKQESFRFYRNRGYEVEAKLSDDKMHEDWAWMFKRPRGK